MTRVQIRDSATIAFVLWLALCSSTSAIPFAADFSILGGSPRKLRDDAGRFFFAMV
jgi:hypothetical protein